RHTVSLPASATRQRRRSPGAGTPKSRRSRPEDPPSSATLTTPVIVPAYSRAACNTTESPCPPPSATTAGPSRRNSRLLTFEVPVVHPGPKAQALEKPPDLGRDHNAAVPSARTPDTDRQ